MPDIYYDVDAALAAVPLNKVPVLDVDGLTVDAGVTYNEAGLSVEWNFVTSAGAFTHTAVTPTDTAGDYDFVNQGEGMYTIEIPASAGASINNDTEGYGWFSCNSTATLPFISPVFGFRAAALNDALCDGGDSLDVNVTAIADDTVTAASINTGALTADAFAADAIVAATLATGALTADAFAADAIVAATLATGALTADAFAANAIVAATLNADCITAAKIADNAISSEHLNTGALTADAFAADAIVAATLATGALTADALAADAVTEIWAKVCEADGSYTAQQILSICLSALAGVTTSAGAVLKSPEVAGATRITATINASNERTAMTLAPSA